MASEKRPYFTVNMSVFVLCINLVFSSGMQEEKWDYSDGKISDLFSRAVTCIQLSPLFSTRIGRIILIILVAENSCGMPDF